MTEPYSAVAACVGLGGPRSFSSTCCSDSSACASLSAGAGLATLLVADRERLPRAGSETLLALASSWALDR